MHAPSKKTALEEARTAGRCNVTYHILAQHTSRPTKNRLKNRLKNSHSARVSQINATQSNTAKSIHFNYLVATGQY
jgi:hypothetical protein